MNLKKNNYMRILLFISFFIITNQISKAQNGSLCKGFVYYTKLGSHDARIKSVIEDFANNLPSYMDTEFALFFNETKSLQLVQRREIAEAMQLTEEEMKKTEYNDPRYIEIKKADIVITSEIRHPANTDKFEVTIQFQMLNSSYRILTTIKIQELPNNTDFSKNFQKKLKKEIDRHQLKNILLKSLCYENDIKDKFSFSLKIGSYDKNVGIPKIGEVILISNVSENFELNGKIKDGIVYFNDIDPKWLGVEFNITSVKNGNHEYKFDTKDKIIILRKNYDKYYINLLR